MRLLNTETLTFQQFFDTDIPRYAILSHRWEPSSSPINELEFQELEQLTAEERKSLRKLTAVGSSMTDQPRGFKVGKFCGVASTHCFEWVWVDTCCIDKRNSAELTEAINSMFRWYKNADRCYVYFNDVEWNQNDPEGSLANFRSSKWFTRGWTLQELLAPRNLQCYDKNWNLFGNRLSLAEQFSVATGISNAHLTDQRTASVAVKMSWAAKRTTSRVEDMAYSLLGLFDINMPMLYGEGANAFFRLQRKIIKRIDDESIFAWTDHSVFKPHGMLAPSPIAFANCGGIRTSSTGTVERRPYTMTNRGLELYVKLPRLEMADLLHPYHTLILGLNCERQVVPDHEGKYIAIELHRFGNVWRRVNCDRPCIYKDVVENSFQVGSKGWSSNGLTETTSIYVVQE